MLSAKIDDHIQLPSHVYVLSLGLLDLLTASPTVILSLQCLSQCLKYSKWSINVSFFELNQTQRLTMGTKRVKIKT